MLNKPKRVLSTLEDPKGRKTVRDFLTKKFESYFPVGRLDYDSSGLVLMTNDGELANRLMHPRYGFERKYQVQVLGHMTDKTVRRIKRGVTLKDGMVKADVRIKRKDNRSTFLDITLTVGRNRIIRRLMEHLHHPVMKLHRIQHGPLRIGRLKSGAVKELTQSDYQRLCDSILGEKKKK